MYLKPTSLVAMEVVRMNNNNLYFKITQSVGISCLCTGMYNYHCTEVVGKRRKKVCKVSSEKIDAAQKIQ